MQDAEDLYRVYELRDRLTICRSLLFHMQERTETRWPGFAEHLDYPEMRDEFKVFINSRLEQGEIKIMRRPLAAATEEAVS